MNIDKVRSSYGAAETLQAKPVKRDPSRSFAADLKGMVGEVDSLQHQADRAMENAALTGAEKIHETMLKVEEANLSLRLMLRLRSKALDAYDQIMRMQF